MDYNGDTQGIGEKRANSIIKLREESPEPFKNVSFFFLSTCYDEYNNF